MCPIRRSTFAPAAALVLITAFPPLNAQFGLSSFTIDGGGGHTSGGPYSLRSTIGQPDASAPMTGGAFSLGSGFWGAGPSTVLSGYAAWAAANIAPGLDASFDGDADEDGFPNGLLYIFAGRIEILSKGILTPPPAVVPADVNLVLETSSDLANWDPLIEYEAGLQTLLEAGVLVTPDTVNHITPDPTLFYRYRAALLP